MSSLPETPHHQALVVDDDKICQLAIKQFLEQLGFIVTVANNGQEAVHLTTATPHIYSLIIMDFNMPIMNGVEATKLIRQHQAQQTLSNTTIIGLTAHVDAETLDFCLDAGMDAVTSKPVDKHTLKRLITENSSKVLAYQC